MTELRCRNGLPRYRSWKCEICFCSLLAILLATDLPGIDPLLNSLISRGASPFSRGEGPCQGIRTRGRGWRGCCRPGGEETLLASTMTAKPVAKDDGRICSCEWHLDVAHCSAHGCITPNLARLASRSRTTLTWLRSRSKAICKGRSSNHARFTRKA